MRTTAPRLALAGLGLLLLAVGLGLARRSGAPTARGAPPQIEELAAPAPPTEHPAPLPPPARAEVVPASAERDDEHPHPITPDHVRNFRQVDLLHGAWRALERRDFARARELVREHRRDYPGQWDDMNEGLEILAECMEAPTPEVVERARTFHRERTGSMMRKRVRRFCLEPAER